VRPDLRWQLWLAAFLTIGAGGSCAGTSQEAKAPQPKAPAPAVPARPAPQPAARPAEFQIAGQMTQGGWIRGTAPQGAVAVSLDGAGVRLSDDGRFFAAFDRDARPTAALTARLADGRSVTRALTVAPRAWKIEHVAVGKRPGAAPSAEYERRRAIETARINAARQIDAESDGWRQQFIWPVRGRLSGLFGSQRIYRGTPGGYHSGTDIATGTSGTVYVAPADGVVILAAETSFTLEGKLLMIDHGMGLNSAFLHSSRLLVREGDRVRQGQPIGHIGMTGRATGPHLHWSIKWKSARLDPILFTGPMR
jgi:murein DD-endopeptidase MepM/ murein hydrolase activator NlpD